MASGGSWDYNCPQYRHLDVSRDLSPLTDSFFASPASRYSKKECIKEEKLTEETENILLEKASLALDALLETPHLKASVAKRKLLKPNKRLTLSKSNESLNTCESKKNLHSVAFAMNAVRKSTSLEDLRVCKKCTYPVTPMCLKRTLTKSKHKVAKTSEDYQMEEIARLQRQTYDHLRMNEQSLKKLNLKSKSSAYSNFTYKPETRTDFKVKKGTTQATVKTIMKENCQRRNPLKFPTENKAPVLGKIIQESNELHFIKPLSSVARSSKNTSSTCVSKNKTTKSFGFHSGLKFASLKMNTAKQLQNSPSKIKDEDASSMMSREHAGKENVPLAELSFSPSTIVKRIRNASFQPTLPTDSMKKRIEKRVTTFARNYTQSSSSGTMKKPL